MFADYILPIISVSGLALLFGLVLGFSAKKFAVKTDPKVDKIIDALPGVNCGGCGFPGCAIFAEKAAAFEVSYNGCPPAGAEGSAAIASLLGVNVDSLDRNVAFVKCDGTDDNIVRNYVYDGPRSCVAASQLATGGNKTCVYSCIGHGSCRNICPFDAISIVKGVAVIIREKCTACGKCVAVCPKGLIEIAPEKNNVQVLCKSYDKGARVRMNCRAGCLGCTVCRTVCPEGAITIENYLAHIDHDKCTMCMACVEKCPAKCIRVL